MRQLATFLVISTFLVSFTFALAGDNAAARSDKFADAPSVGNRLAYLDGPVTPYYPTLHMARLTTPQWIGTPNVRAAIILSTDDLQDSAIEKFEKFWRPSLNRLRAIDGRAPLSIMSLKIDLNNSQVKSWLDEGVSLEAHTIDHRHPILQGGDLAASKKAYDDMVDLLTPLPKTKGSVAYRMPYCDSVNTNSPRFFSEIFSKTTPGGKFLELDSSVFVNLTQDDPALPATVATDEAGRPRFAKYNPTDRNFANYIEDYPYPYTIGNFCWELPMMSPSDWQAGHHLGGHKKPELLRDMKAAVDGIVAKQGVDTIIAHPHGWIGSDQLVKLIDYADKKYGKSVLFLNFAEVRDRLTKNLLLGQPLRNAKGGDNGVRILDINNDGFMDVVIANDQVKKTRVWQPKTGSWLEADFPVSLIESGGHFGVLDRSGNAYFLTNRVLKNKEQQSGLWRWNKTGWTKIENGLAGLTIDGKEILTAKGGVDLGTRLRDINADGLCELIVGSPEQSGVLKFIGPKKGWTTEPYRLPEGVTIVDARGRDAGARLVDIDEDGRLDIVFSNGDHYSFDIFDGDDQGWSRRLMAGPAGKVPEGAAFKKPIPAIVRADGTNNGAWFKYRHMWVQNEDTTGNMPNEVDTRYFTNDFLAHEKEPPGRTPQGELAAIIPKPGFTVELMAAEPMVLDPIDLAWAPDGSLWVTEMADYPMGYAEAGHYGPPETPGIPCGRVRRLTDTNGDGQYDKSVVFMDKIPFPTGVMPWRDGVLITAAPLVFFAKDINGDGKADFRETLFDGFHEGNQQHRVNFPRWRLDNWISLANGDSDGKVISKKTGEVINISGADLRINPDTGQIDRMTGRSQYGRSRDDWGNWFGCNNSWPAFHFSMDDHYLARNPFVALPSLRHNVSEIPSAWPAGRVMTHCFYDQPTPQEGQPGRWTSISGVTVYRDDLFGPEYEDNIFSSDSVYNVITRAKPRREGIKIFGDRAADELKSEFVASVDPNFRPATARTGPDGALWVADMYRYVIEHPEWINDELEKELELQRYNDRGRIFRIYPVGKKPRAIPDLTKLNLEQLVAAMDSPSGWQRDMVQQMLIWKNDLAAVPFLEKLVKTSKRPQTRLQALCSLDGLDKLSAEMLLLGLEDPHPGVRRHAVRLCEGRFDLDPRIAVALKNRLGDYDEMVLLQLAYSLGEWKSPKAAEMLAEMAIRYESDPQMFAAVMSSTVPHAKKMAELIGSNKEQSAEKLRLAAKLDQLADDIREWNETDPEDRIIERQAAGEFLIGRETPPEITTAIEKFKPALKLKGDPVRGAKMFEEATCSLCHRLDSIGEHIGPDLLSLVDRSPPVILLSVIDPNVAIKERYLQYTLVTVDGLTIQGQLMEETSNSLTLADTTGKKHSVLRKDIEEIICDGLSNMPEKLEAKLELQQMADMLAFVHGAKAEVAPASKTAEKTVEKKGPTLVRPDEKGVLNLESIDALASGPEVKYMPKEKAFGWFTSRDKAEWNIEVPETGLYEGYLTWSVDKNNAGHPWILLHGTTQMKVGLLGAVGESGGWETSKTVPIGRLKLQRGRQRIIVSAGGSFDGYLFDLFRLEFVPVKE
jgi:putative membrane-bound dehydrogenase-like protein